MTDYGMTLSSEEHDPRTLVRNAVRAEDVGFSFCSISDHFHPWIAEQGHSPFVWGVLGAIANATSSIDVGTGVTCPIIRIPPTIVAHAAATTSQLFEGRFFLGVGTGEALNEHINGDRWPRPAVRRDMLAEALVVIRRLWTGETVDHRGEYYEVENARLFDPPVQPMRIIVSGFGDAAVELAAAVGDGYWGHTPDKAIVDKYIDAGGSGPRYAQMDLCYGATRDACIETVMKYWPNAGVTGQLSQDLPTWTHFEQAVKTVRAEDATAHLPCGPDIGAIVDSVEQYREAGYDHIYFHQIGPDQEAFVKVWDNELRDAIGG
ncbi:MAG: TIGR03557 family F420-dependent LLM class oxidoreductase [Acidimicrobiia bacterium]